ncbi:hypothetical protein AK812_SmicGene21415 [Symbiodinium microadriaticum]|uniref:Uncharacterized protein n=1 Tax=Symbiodinium microadriaticum TaxID=2951 RepID=A0A1Q9DMH4_SYMMI|nr:hypothetical protein AK812_SmicGene21415 [Symbiodinium microadriaticum]
MAEAAMAKEEPESQEHPDVELPAAPEGPQASAFLEWQTKPAEARDKAAPSSPPKTQKIVDLNLSKFIDLGINFANLDPEVHNKLRCSKSSRIDALAIHSTDRCYNPEGGTWMSHYLQPAKLAWDNIAALHNYMASTFRDYTRTKQQQQQQHQQQQREQQEEEEEEQEEEGLQNEGKWLDETMICYADRFVGANGEYNPFGRHFPAPPAPPRKPGFWPWLDAKKSLQELAKGSPNPQYYLTNWIDRVNHMNFLGWVDGPTDVRPGIVSNAPDDPLDDATEF